MRTLFSIILIVGLSGFSLLDQPVVLEEGNDSYSLGLYLEILEDTTGELTFAQIQSEEYARLFTKNEVKTPNFSFSSSVYWLRFQVKSDLSSFQTWVLELGFPLHDYVDFYVLAPDSSVNVIRTGDRRPFHMRPINHRNFVLELPIDLEQLYTVYIRFQTYDGLHESIPLFLWHENRFAFENIRQTITHGIYYGILAVMILYNLLIFFSVRDRSYFFYVLYLVGFLLWSLSFYGYSFQFFWPNFPDWGNQILPFYAGFFQLQIVLFIRAFLNTPKYLPKIDTFVAKGVIIGSLITMTSSLLGYYSFSYIILVFTGIYGFPMAIIGGVVRLRQGYRPARFFLLAWVSLSLGAVFMLLKMTGLIPSNFLTENGMQIGSALEVILISLALADKINQEKKDKYLAQKETLIVQEKALEAEYIAFEEQESLTNAYARFVPQDFLRFLEKENIQDVELGDSVKKKMTILFSDIRSFTSLSESMSSEDNFKFLNAYLKRMGPIVRKHDGVIDKYIGDAVMALFSKCPDDAIKSAISMLKLLEKYNESRQQVGRVPIKIGIGINTGEVMLGTIGESNRMEGTVISDAVNLAARLEAHTKRSGASILISQGTLQALLRPEDFAIRLIDKIAFKGKTNEVSIFEIFDADPPDVIEKKHQTKSFVEEGVMLYAENKLPECLSVFEEIFEIYPEDLIVQQYIKRCKY
jgi:class 3 adenylate cyclase